jgi:hypothetical protein
VFGVTAASRNTRFRAARYGLTWAGLSPADRASFAWRLPSFDHLNYVATYNEFERRFAEFLDNKAADVLRFAALGTTEQGESGTQFRVDYLKPSGAIGFYQPDWVVVQKTKAGEVNWIIETKGRVWEGTAAKVEAIREWCERIAVRRRARYAAGGGGGGFGGLGGGGFGGFGGSMGGNPFPVMAAPGGGVSPNHPTPSGRPRYRMSR